MVKKAQINLCWCLYLLEEEHAPLKEVMNNYITMFYGPLQPHIIVALTTLFGTPTPTTQLDEAMNERVSGEIEELQTLIVEANM